MKTITIQIPDDCGVQIIKKEEKKEATIKTYQDLIDNKIKIEKGYWITKDSTIFPIKNVTILDNNRNIASSEKVAKSMLAMAMISQLMPYYGGEITNEEWADKNITKHTINKYNNEINFDGYCLLYQFLAFHTKQQRDEFFKYNERLVKDYLMID